MVTVSCDYIIVRCLCCGSIMRHGIKKMSSVEYEGYFCDICHRFVLNKHLPMEHCRTILISVKHQEVKTKGG